MSCAAVRRQRSVDINAAPLLFFEDLKVMSMSSLCLSPVAFSEITPAASRCSLAGIMFAACLY